MNVPATPPPDQGPPGKPRSPQFIPGLAAGVLLWGIITFATQNMVLGLVFGLGSGIAIGLGLQVTRRR